MRRHLPNILTVLRLVLAVIFFVVLNQYRFSPISNFEFQISNLNCILIASIVLFILAAITDLLDGHLARKWNVESAFGRIMDPVCDKVLVLGAFIYLAGPRMIAHDGSLVSGVYPWMVVVVLSRELLVTSVRAAMESSGHKFGAMRLGKWKMILQSVVVPVVLAIILLDPTDPDHRWLAITRDVLVYLTILVTLLSGLPYMTAAARAMRGNPNKE